MAAHVEFLSSPALRGRKPLSRGSRAARDYIAQRFKAYGLTPWRGEEDYTLSFGYGHNVAGLLQGSDPLAADQIVIVCAHYDHLGRSAKGEIYPGAVDNASGIAVLLETARKLTMHGNRPKRTIAFIAFDAEEQGLLGSFAFTTRPDVQQAEISAVVNADMLGRDFLDAVPNTLFVAGTEGYPQLRKRIVRLGTESAIRVLPVGSDLIGARSDHVPFESPHRPALFFTCGPFRDYHQPTDTPDKLNYALLESSAQLIAGTVQELTAGEPLNRHPDLKDAYAAELQTMNTVLTEIIRNPAAAAVSTQQLQDLAKLHSKTELHLAGGNYTAQIRGNLIVEIAAVLFPQLLPFAHADHDKQQANLALWVPLFQELYLNYRTQLTEGYRSLISHILKHRPGPFRNMPKFEYEFCDLTEQDVVLTRNGPDEYALAVALVPVSLLAEAAFWSFPPTPFRIEFAFEWTGLNARGTLNEVQDCCLLRLRSEQSNPLRAQQIAKVLRYLPGIPPDTTPEQLLSNRLRSDGFDDEIPWIAHCIQSQNPNVALEAIRAARNSADSRLLSALREVIVNRQARPDVRAAAIRLASNHPDRDLLLALCEALEDTHPIGHSDPVLRPDYPFQNRAWAKLHRKLFEDKTRNPDNSKTVAEVAADELKRIAKRNFGTDAAAWRRWIQRSRRLH